MPSYRITKYDPLRRSPDGSYPLADWTSVVDVGTAEGSSGTLTMEEYVDVETAYVESVRRLMNAVGVPLLRVTDVERRIHGGDRVADYLEGQELSGDQLEEMIRGCLREELWCRLHGESGFFVHFGYDLYMYVGFDAPLRLPPMPDRVFAEPFESPYRRLE